MTQVTNITQEIVEKHDTIIVLDFGSQYSHLITRRLRDLGVYSELLSFNTEIQSLSYKPKGIILSGGPNSVTDVNAPHLNSKWFDQITVPTLGICYGMQELVERLGGKVAQTEIREYGEAKLQIVKEDGLFNEVENDSTVWMSHGDHVSMLPNGFKTIGSTSTNVYTAIQNMERKIFGLQFHPEVSHSKAGMDILNNFIRICNCIPSWSMENFLDIETRKIEQLLGPDTHVIGAVSGGVDSSVAATLMKNIIGDRFHAVFVDNGLLRLNERENVKMMLEDQLGLDLTIVDARGRFLEQLKRVTDPEQKRNIIGTLFVEIFEEEAKKLNKIHNNKIRYLLQGTLYPDRIESFSPYSTNGPSHVIKSHHNVGPIKLLLDKMHLKLVEPLENLFKDEVRRLASVLNIPKDLVMRHPFPGPGLAIRIVGDVSEDKLNIVRLCDNILIEELRLNNLYELISQAYVALIDIRTVGVQGDQRTYDYPVVIRYVYTSDFMTSTSYPLIHESVIAKISNKIVNEVVGVNRVWWDFTSKPPATIELE